MLNELGYALQQIWNKGEYTFSQKRNDLDITDFEYIKKEVCKLMDNEQMDYEVKGHTIKVLV